MDFFLFQLSKVDFTQIEKNNKIFEFSIQKFGLF